MKIAAASGITLLAARILAAAAPGDSVALPALPLALLGLGWNFGLVSSTAITSDTVAARVSGLGALEPLLAVVLRGDRGSQHPRPRPPAHPRRLAVAFRGDRESQRSLVVR